MSPGGSPVKVKECIEEALKFTLKSSMEETLDIDLRFSSDYCSNLLLNPYTPELSSHSRDCSEGVPSYPLYKHVASALLQSITSGAFCGARNKETSIIEDNILKMEEEWNSLILDKGSELLNMLRAVDFELHVQEPFFSQLKDGQKIIEGRCAVGDYNRIRPGARILFNRCLVLVVQDVHRYASFSEMLEVENLAQVLPGVETVKEGVEIYRKFYTEEKERSNGVLAIFVAKTTAQPYTSLAGILSGLGYAGVQSLLGLSHTEGTIPEALPPPRSTLISSFTLRHNPNVVP